MPQKPAASTIQEVVTINDLTCQILANSEVLFPNKRDLKVVSGQSPNGRVFNTSIVASDPKSASVHKEYKEILGVNGTGTDRRSSMLALLEETERRVTKEVLKK